MLTGRASHAAGFTAIELMVTLSILAILSALAMPSFQTFMAENRARSKSIELTSALQTAQSESKTRNRMIVFTLTDSAKPTASLTGSATGKGWATVVRPLVTSGTNEVISVGGAQDTASDASLSAESAAVCFLPDGSIKAVSSTGITSAACAVDATNGVRYQIRPSRGDKEWQVSISPSGKIGTCVGKRSATGVFTCN